jgi:DNA polymerase-3 subunit alpha
MHSFFSLRYGVLPPKEVLKHYLEGGFPYALLCDVNNTSATLDFIRMAQEMKIPPVAGIDFRRGARRQFLAIARNNEGFRQMNALLSECSAEDADFPLPPTELKESLIIYPFRERKWPQQLRENEYITVEPADLPRFRIWSGAEGLPYIDKTLAIPTMSFRHKRDHNIHRLLRAIDTNCLLSKLPTEQQADEGDRYRNRKEIDSLYEGFEALLHRADALLSECRLEFGFGPDQPSGNLKNYTDSEQGDYELMRRLCREGMRYRYPSAGKEIHQRLEKELEAIRQKGFLSYFLISWDITSYARSKGYFYVGRGSGANSMVAYLLRITDVDPVELDLYFERFINLYRRNPPDFDIDFSWTDREDITAYIFRRFRHATLLAAHSTFQYRAIVRELGKVFGLPKFEIDKLSEGRFNIKEIDEFSRLVLQYSALMQDFPNVMSIHAGGILITEKPIHHYTATFLPPKGYPTTHFDMVVAEDAGLHKFDILSQRGLAKIRESLDIIRQNQPDEPEIDIHDIARFKQDERVKDLLRNALAIGCFYVESPAMRMLLKKLQVDDYLGLVAASSVIRPGVAKSGMMREYILRFRFPERRKDANPVLMEIMPETFGVMVYQEDVIKVAHYFAGLDLGEADHLRRGMSGKFRSREEFAQTQEAFFRKAAAKGHAPNLIAEVWRQIESFAGYAFAKGHSASYAVESYQSLFLKAYYPLEYLVATINNSGGFYRTEFYVHEARMNGAIIQPPCVNAGNAVSRLRGNELILGFGLVNSLEQETIADLLAARENGDFLSVEDFVQRVKIGLEQLSILIRVGAFGFTRKDKKTLLWEAHFLLGKDKKSAPSLYLFETPKQPYTLPQFNTAEAEEAFDQMELLGFPLCDPFSLLREPLRGDILSRELPDYKDKVVLVAGYLVTVKLTRTSGGEGMFFGTFTDREGHWLDTVHFPQVAAKFPFRGKGLYAVRGKVCEEFGCYSIETEWMQKLPVVEDPRFSEANTVTRLHQGRSRAETKRKWEQ